MMALDRNTSNKDISNFNTRATVPFTVVSKATAAMYSVYDNDDMAAYVIVVIWKCG